MIRIRFFGPGELIQNYIRAAQYTTAATEQQQTQTQTTTEQERQLQRQN